MPEALYATLISLLKLALIVIGSPIVGSLGLATTPFRFWQAVSGRIKGSTAALSASAKASVYTGTVVIFLATIGWAIAIHEIYSAITCISVGCALAGLDVFLVISAFGIVYGVAELLLFPATFPRHRNT